jgi:hypothetical protein
MKKLLIVLASASLSYAEKNTNVPKVSNASQIRATVNEEPQKEELKTRLLKMANEHKTRGIAAAKVGGSVLAIGLLGYGMLKALKEGVSFEGSQIENVGVDRDFYLQAKISIYADARLQINNRTVAKFAQAACCGYIAYKLLEVVIENAPIVVNGK